MLMNPRIILYAIVGGLSTFMGLSLLLAQDYIWGIALTIIGVLNVFQMYKLSNEKDSKF